VTVPPLPTGFRIALDRSTRPAGPAALAGGSPARRLRLSPAGARALAELRAGPIRTAAGGRLARFLCDTGLAHPRPPRPAGPPDLTVVIPVKDHAVALDRCLSALGRNHRVIVVDDGSADPRPIAAAAAAHGATLIRRPRCGGPGAARDTGLSLVDTPLVALVDSDCTPPPDWIERLAAHLADPLVAVAAPRVVAAPRAGRRGALSRYHAAAGSLDMGPDEAGVAPRTRIAYVPTAALVVRRSALAAVARHGAVFDPALRYGEDVDLVWRLHAAGWRIRYDPSVRVPHRPPARWRELLARRFHYGTSAPDLAERHPGSVPPTVLEPLTTAAIVAAVAGRPVLAAATLAADAYVGHRGAATRTGSTARRLGWNWLGLGRYAGQFAAPVLVAAALVPGRPVRRVAAAALLVAPGLHDWYRRRPTLDPVRYTLAVLADNAAYGSGVWYASARRRTAAALIPAVPRRSAPAPTTRV
jgi:mycofactocin system glycosyltransferase